MASDSSPIIEHTRIIIFLDEGEMAVINKNSYEVRNINEDEKINKTINKIEYSLEEIEKSEKSHKEFSLQLNKENKKFKTRFLRYRDFGVLGVKIPLKLYYNCIVC